MKIKGATALIRMGILQSENFQLLWNLFDSSNML